MLAGAAQLAVAGAAAGMGAAMVGALVDAEGKAREFELQMKTVGALIGTTVPDDIVALTDKARELGSTTAFSATQASEGMEALAMAGFNTNEILDAMKPLLDAAGAAQSDLGDTANIVSNIMSGFNIPASETGRIADILTATFTSSNTRLETLGETLKFAAPIAKSAGTSLAEAAAAAGLMGNAGIQGSMAGTALRATLLRLQAPTGRAKDAIEELEIELRKSDGTMKPLPDLIEAIQGGLNKLNPAQQTALIKDLIGEEAMAGFQILLEAGPKKIRDYAATLENSLGRAAEIAKQKMDTTEGSLKTMLSSFESLQITVGDKASPVFRSFLDNALTPAIRGLDDWAQNTTGWQKATDVMVTGLSLGIVPLFGTILPNVFDKAEDKLRDFFDISDRSQDIFKEIDQAGGQMQGTYDDLAASVSNLTTEIGMGANIQIQALTDFVGPAVSETLAFKDAAKDATQETAAWWAEINELNDKFNALGTKLDPQASKDAGTDIVMNLAAGIQESVPLLEQEGLTAGEALATGIKIFFGGDGAGGGAEGQDIVAAGVTEMLNSHSLRSSFEVAGSSIGAIIGNAWGHPIGAALGEHVVGAFAGQLGGLVDDLVSRIPGLGGPGRAALTEGGLTAAEVQAIDDLLASDADINLATATQQVLKQSRAFAFSDQEWVAIFDMVQNEGLSFDQAKQRIVDIRTKRDGVVGTTKKNPVGTPKGSSADDDPPPPPSGKVVASPHQQAFDYLLANMPGSVSRSVLRGFGLQAVRMAATDLSGLNKITPALKSAIEAVAAGASVPNGPLGGGVILKAAHGMSGIVTRPTHILAGEAGPERVNITPTDGGRDPGAMGSKQIFVNFSIQTLDPRQVDESAIERFADVLIRKLRDKSELGEEIIHERGMIREVAV